MTTEKHRQVEKLFDDLVDLSSTRREEELARLCPQDAEVLKEVHRLLASADKNIADGDPGFVRDLFGEGLLADSPYEDQLEGSSIGPYHILCKLGEGGFGAVYKAEQRQPVRRTVALKLIKLGFDTKEVIARFNSERQALARMDHPNIAKVLDAGSTDQGRPYFVLDYVAGLSITSFADQNRLSIKERLLLFVQVCDAIAHAHQKAIIHRDIKSGNRGALAPFARSGAAVGSLHPMQAFGGSVMPNLKDVIFAVEGDPKAVRIAASIAKSLGGIPVAIASRDKATYHAAAVLAAGSIYATIEAGLQLLMRAGFTRERAGQTLFPLMRQIFDNIERIGPRAAWTGPLSRQDYEIVSRHARALRTGSPEVRKAYAALAMLAASILSGDPREAKKRTAQALAV